MRWWWVLVLVMVGALVACASAPRNGDLGAAWKGWTFVRDLTGVCAPEPPAWLSADAGERFDDAGDAELDEPPDAHAADGGHLDDAHASDADDAPPDDATEGGTDGVPR